MDRAPVADWEGHVIVCGLQGVGLRTVELLHQAGVQVVVVDEDPDPRLVRIVESWEIPFIVGSPRLGGFLDRAGLADRPGRGLRRADRGRHAGDGPPGQRAPARHPGGRATGQHRRRGGGGRRHRTGHRARRGLAGRPVHRGVLPGQRLVPDRARRHPLRDGRGGGGPRRLVAGPVRGPCPHRRGTGGRVAHRGLPRPGPPGTGGGPRHRARHPRGAGGSRPPSAPGRTSTARVPARTAGAVGPGSSDGPPPCWAPTTTAPCASPSWPHPR